MNDIIRIIKSLKNSSVSNDGVIETAKHEIKKQEKDFLVSMLLETLRTSVLGSMLAGEGVIGGGRVNEYRSFG